MSNSGEKGFRKKRLTVAKERLNELEILVDHIGLTVIKFLASKDLVVKSTHLFIIHKNKCGCPLTSLRIFKLNKLLVKA